METTIRFLLTRPARARGGDRYEAKLAGEDKPMVVYIPQQISRDDNSVPYPGLEISITPLIQ